MSSVVLNSNIASVGVQRRLAESTSKLGRNFERLSSGSRINRPNDDSAGLAIASGLSVDRRVFAQGVRNLQDGVSYLSIVEGATGELKNVLFRLRELSTQSSNGTLSNGQRQALDKEAQSLVNEYNRILAITSFNEITMFDESRRELTIQAGYGSGGRLNISLSLTTTTLAGDGTFQPHLQEFGIGPDPYSVTVGDFNGDGIADLITANFSGDHLSVLLGNGDGSFQPAVTTTSTGNQPNNLVVGDFNNDGRSDVAVSRTGSNQMSVLLGNGDGSFQPRVDYAAGSSSDIALGDFNSDGILDLVTADNGPDSLSVFLGNGNGTFQPRAAYTVGFFPKAVVVADFNSDGISDLASADSTNISVLFGNGDGTFQPFSSYALGTVPQTLAVGDLNGDGAPDIVSDRVLLNNGDGTFQVGALLGVGSWSTTITDLNGDGHNDVALANTVNASVLLGNGDGTFQPRADFGTGSTPRGIAVADFNRDGGLDLVTVNTTSNSLSVLIANVAQNERTTTIRPLSGVDVASQSAALASQSIIDGYLDEVNTVVGVIGSAMSRFEAAAQNLQVQMENFAEAESRIVDADIAEEAASLVKNRILQQAGAAVLAQANQLPAMTLALLSA